MYIKRQREEASRYKDKASPRPSMPLPLPPPPSIKSHSVFCAGMHSLFLSPPSRKCKQLGPNPARQLYILCHINLLRDPVPDPALFSRAIFRVCLRLLTTQARPAETILLTSFRGNADLSQLRLTHLASRDHHTSLWDAGDQVREELCAAAEWGGRRVPEAAL